MAFQSVKKWKAGHSARKKEAKRRRAEKKWKKSGRGSLPGRTSSRKSSSSSRKSSSSSRKSSSKKIDTRTSSAFNNMGTSSAFNNTSRSSSSSRKSNNPLDLFKTLLQKGKDIAGNLIPGAGNIQQAGTTYDERGNPISPEGGLDPNMLLAGGLPGAFGSIKTAPSGATSNRAIGDNTLMEGPLSATPQYKNTGSTNILTKAWDKLRNYQTERFANKYGIDANEAKRLKDISSFNQDMAGTIRGVDSGNLAKKWVAGVITADILTDWYALDNVMSGQLFFLKDIKDNVENGNTNPTDALRSLEESQKTMELANDKINYSTMLNPLMWPFRNLLMTGAAGQQDAYDLIATDITNMAAAAGAEGTDGEVVSDPSKGSGGGTPAEWLAYAQEKDRIDDENRQEWEDAKIRADEREKNARRRERKEEAAFWIAYKEKILKLEEEARIEQEKFWKEYREKMAPSALNFGLL